MKTIQMKQIRYTTVLMLLMASISWAQQETAITQYWENMNLINPAYVGHSGQTTAALIIRDQWTGIPEAPESQMFSFGTSLGKNVGLGLSLMRDKTFIEKETFLSIDFSYKVSLSDKTDLYLGLKAAGNTYSVNTEGLETYNIVGDPSLVSFSDFTPNIGLGGLLKRGDFYLSFSIPRLLNTERARNDNGQATVATDRPHLYTSTGYSFKISKSKKWSIDPSVLLRYVDGSPVSIDFNTMLRLKQGFGIGMTYRTDQAVAGVASLQVTDHMVIGYAYESSTRAELARAKATNEFMLRFVF